MKTVKTKVYTFDELSPKAKEVARKWYKEGDEMPFMEEYMQEFCVGLLADNKIEGEPKLYYSLSYSQGDGAMFEGTFTWKKYTATIKHSGHYYHKNSKTIDLTYLKVKNDIETEEYATEKVYEQFERLYVSICKELEREGYSYIEHENSNEVVDENILANEYTFTESGTRFG